MWHESVSQPLSFQLGEIATDIGSYRIRVYDAEHLRTISKTDSEVRAEKWCEKTVTTKPDMLSRTPITPLQRKYLDQAKTKLMNLEKILLV